MVPEQLSTRMGLPVSSPDSQLHWVAFVADVPAWGGTPDFVVYRSGLVGMADKETSLLINCSDCKEGFGLRLRA